MSKIILYEDKNFGGRTLVLTEGAKNLEKFKFNDIVSSIRVEVGSWTVYDDKNFSGPSYTLEPGEYPEPKAWGGRDDELSSAQPSQ